MKKTGISREGMEPEWVAKEVEKSNQMIRAWMLEEQGEVDTALSLYAQAAQTEEELAEYCRQLGLRDKTWISAVSAAGCWARAGDLHRALQQYETLSDDPSFTPKMRNRACELADELREQRRQWSAFRRQRREEEERKKAETARAAERAAA